MSESGATVIYFPHRTYTAKLKVLHLSGYTVRLAGTLDGFIDVAIESQDRKYMIYNIGCDDAYRLIAALHAVITDIQTNCLFERDALLGERPIDG